MDNATTTTTSELYNAADAIEIMELITAGATVDEAIAAVNPAVVGTVTITEIA